MAEKTKKKTFKLKNTKQVSKGRTKGNQTGKREKGSSNVSSKTGGREVTKEQFERSKLTTSGSGTEFLKKETEAGRAPQEVIDKRNKEVQANRPEAGIASRDAEEKKSGLLGEDELLGQTLGGEPVEGVKDISPAEGTGLQKGALKVLGALDLTRTAEDIANINSKEEMGKSVRDTLITGTVAAGAAGLLATLSPLAGIAAIYGINTFVLEPAELATWAQTDNVAGASGFNAKAAASAFLAGQIDAATMEEILAESEAAIDGAQTFVEQSTMLDPKLMPVGDGFLGAIDASRTALDLSKARVGL